MKSESHTYTHTDTVISGLLNTQCKLDHSDSLIMYTLYSSVIIHGGHRYIYCIIFTRFVGYNYKY